MTHCTAYSLNTFYKIAILGICYFGVIGAVTVPLTIMGLSNGSLKVPIAVVPVLAAAMIPVICLFYCIISAICQIQKGNMELFLLQALYFKLTASKNSPISTDSHAEPDDVYFESTTKKTTSIVMNPFDNLEDV